MVLEKTPESPLECKEIKPVNPKGNQLRTFIGRTDAEAPILQPPDAKSRLTGKDPDAGKDRGLAKYGVAEDETARWHHRHNGHELEQTPGDIGVGRGAWHATADGSQRVRHDLATINNHQQQSTVSMYIL